MLEPYDGDINEFYIDVEVKNPKVEYGPYVTYEIAIETNNISFTEGRSAVRRRYSEFVLLRKLLVKEFLAWKLPSLPPKFPFKNHFDPVFIEKRRKGLEEFVKKLVQEKIYLSSKAMHLFLQSSISVPEIKEIIHQENIPAQSQYYDRFINPRFPMLNSTSALSDEISTLSLSSQTDVDASVNSFPSENSAAHSAVSTKSENNSPAESKRVSFCDQVTVAQIFIK